LVALCICTNQNATKNTPPNHLAGDSIISVVLAVKNVEVKELIAILRPLTSQHGYLAAYQPSNSIIMTDSAASVKRIKDMVSLLDQKVDDDYEIIADFFFWTALPICFATPCKIGNILLASACFK
jgi:type II secretory pathway component GspD/PulD (secretin)